LNKHEHHLYNLEHVKISTLKGNCCISLYS